MSTYDRDPRARRQVLVDSALTSWRWRALETIANHLPPWLHLRVCPFCRGMGQCLSKGERHA